MVVAEMEVQPEHQMVEAAILVSVPQTAAAHHKALAATEAADPQTAASTHQRTAVEPLPQAARQKAVAELLNTGVHPTDPVELVLQESRRKGDAATKPQVVH